MMQSTVKGAILLETYNQMQTSNKIKSPPQNIEVQSAQFQQFVQTLKEKRPIRYNQISHSDHNVSELSRPHNFQEESSPAYKELYSQRSQSLYMQSSRKSDVSPHLFGGDQVLKNKGKVGVANRYAIKQYGLPPQYFTPTKIKLQQFLKDSRILPYAGTQRANTPAKNQIFQQNELSNKPVRKTKNRRFNLQQFNAEIALKYCQTHHLQQHSTHRQILTFFVRLLDTLGFTLPEPAVQKHKDCIYFGMPTKKRQLSQGFLFFYADFLYAGQLLQQTMHGNGIQIFFKDPAIYKGEFKDGKMHGYFQVTNSGQKYSGFIQNGLYNGRGKLQTRAGIFQGQFRDGKLIATSKSTPKESLYKNSSGFRIRGNSHQRPSYANQIEGQHMQRNMRYYNDREPRQSEIDPWSYPQSTPRVKKQKVRSFNDLMQFSYAFGNEILQERNNASKATKSKGKMENPQNKIIWKRPAQRERARQLQYPDRLAGPIREETHSGQEQPLELKC